MEFISDAINQYVRAELLVLIPVLYVVRKFLQKMKVKECRIPLIVGISSVVLCALHTFSTVALTDWSSVLMAVFASLTQGLLIAFASYNGGDFIMTAMTGKTSTERQAIRLAKAGAPQPDSTAASTPSADTANAGLSLPIAAGNGTQADGEETPVALEYKPEGNGNDA